MRKQMYKIKNFGQLIKNARSTNLRVREIKYFSTDGIKDIPNGHPIQKGGFVKECIDNSNKFLTNNYQYLITEKFDILEAIHPNQYDLFDYRGGILIFSIDVNSLELSSDFLIKLAKKKLKTNSNRFFIKSKLGIIVTRFNTLDKKNGSGNIDDYIGAFSIGNFFSGSYNGDNSKVFNENSISFEVNGISSKGLIYLAEEIANELNQETLLVNDMNVNKRFLVYRDRI
jgi:hypothetical protein